jgi:heavy metal sensor kinase
MTPLSVRAQLALGFITVLVVATLTLGVGAWWLFETTIVQAADAALATRVDGTRRFIEATERELPAEEVLDEFREFAELTSGETLLEVTDDQGRVLCRPAMAGWTVAGWPISQPGALEPSDQRVADQPFRVIAMDLIVAGHHYRLAAAISMAAPYAALRRFTWLLGALAATVMLAGAVAGFWWSRRALAPLDRMTRDARLISGQHLDRRLVVPPADDELRRLALTFNDLLQRLQNAFADMVRFTAEASHELRTPVSIARTTAEISLARPRSADEYRVTVGELLVQSERLSRLVDDLMILARADAGIEASETDEVDLQAAIAGACRDVEPLAARRDLRILRKLTLDALCVSGSAESIRRLLVILLDNALKYSPPGGTVTVRALSSDLGGDAQAVIEVIDAGPGIALPDRARVFDRFYRGAEARQLASDGSGLGLSIALTIVERHSGHIVLDDGPGGRGCRVRVTMPRRAPQE